MLRATLAIRWAIKSSCLIAPRLKGISCVSNKQFPPFVWEENRRYKDISANTIGEYIE